MQSLIHPSWQWSGNLYLAEDGDYWLTMFDLSYGPSTVPAGFRTDLASVLLFLSGVLRLPRSGRHNKNAVLHDYLTRHPELVERKTADRVFLDTMRKDGIDPYRRALMYLGVRAAHRLKL